MRHIAPNGWTVIVSLEKHWDATARRGGIINQTLHFIQYAFVRTNRQRTFVDDPHPMLLDPEELQVVGSKDFLVATASEVDYNLLGCHLQDVADEIKDTFRQRILLPDVELLSVLKIADATNTSKFFVK